MMYSQLFSTPPSGCGVWTESVAKEGEYMVRCTDSALDPMPDLRLMMRDLSSSLSLLCSIQSLYRSNWIFLISSIIDRSWLIMSNS